ncbi:DUF5979 domain-containing protein [Antribacter gilvus]|uniref:DUF5979 domain-containing protein n=1 Tax=Antribacter gilvus TaxID=2304675 RepID=UPI0013DF4977|nr:DUF5979 domain-containing protein [Antribacter gilvus]
MTSPLRRLAAALATAALALSGAVVSTSWTAPLAVAEQAPVCPPAGDVPPWTTLPDDGPLYTDNAVSMWAGGDFTVTGATAESEGVTVVMGDATMSKTVANDGWYGFNFGVVGVGSQIAPEPMSVMLTVGGDLTVKPGYSITVGYLIGGGVAVVGNTSGTVDTHGGPVLTQEAAAEHLAQYQHFGAKVNALSSALDALPANGTATLETRGGETALVLTAGTPDAAGRQVFTVPGADFAAATRVDFDSLPVNADGSYPTVVVNVTGGPVAAVNNSTYVNGTMVAGDGYAGPELGNVSTAIMWNFPDAGSVNLASTQDGVNFLGSILVPHGSMVTDVISTNGRLYVGGSYTMGDSMPNIAAHAEHHNYPWTGASASGCDDNTVTPVSGEVYLTKHLTPGSFVDDLLAQTPGAVVARGELVCTDTDGTVLFSREWTLVPGRTVYFDGIPFGATCTVTEQPGLYLTDGSPLDTQGFTWAQPTITVGGQATSTFTVTDSAPEVEVDVTNTLLGSFDLTKQVVGTTTDAQFGFTWTATGPDGAAATGYQVPAAGGPAVPVTDASTGTVTVGAGGTVSPVVGGSPVLFPTGTTVTVEETALPEPGAGSEWAPSLSPDTVTVGGHDPTVSFTAVNTLQQKPARFAVTKTVTGDGADLVDPDATYTFEYSVDGAPAAEPIVVRAGETVLSPDLPEGAVITIAEKDVPQFTGVEWADPQLEGTFTVHSGAQSPYALPVVNTAVPVDRTFRIYKDVTGAAAGSVPGGTELTVDYSVNGGEQTGTLTLTADGTVVDGPTLKYGDTVTFSEATPPAVDGVVWGSATFSVDGTVLDDATITLDSPDDVPVAVTLTNQAKLPGVGFVIHKKLAGAADQLDPGAVFGVRYRINDSWDQHLLLLRADGTVINGPSGLQAGDRVVFTESITPWGDPRPPAAPGGGFWDQHPVLTADGSPVVVDDSGQWTVTLGADTVVEVELTNALLAAPAFTVAKQVTGEAAGQVPADTVFVVGWEVTSGPNAGMNGSLALPADGTPVPGPALTKGDVLHFTTESAPDLPGVTWGTPTLPPDQTWGEWDGYARVLTVTNVAELPATGTFQVNKQVGGDLAGSVPQGTDFTVDYTVDGVPQPPLTVPSGGLVTSPEIPVGAEVVVTETTFPEIAGVTWGEPQIANGTFTIAEDAQVTVTVTNEADAAPAADIYLQKLGQAVGGDPVPLDGAEFQLLADEGGTPGTVLGDLPVTPVTGETGRYVVTAIPAGTYWLQEIKAPSGYDLLPEPVQFLVGSDGSVNVALPERHPQVTATSADGGAIDDTLQVVDRPVLTLPFTGGPGATLSALGLATLGAAVLAAALALRRRRSVPRRH